MKKHILYLTLLLSIFAFAQDEDKAKETEVKEEAAETTEESDELSLDAGGEEGLMDMDLDALLNVEVTSVSKKAEPMFKAASAIFVVTADDIKRMGARTIPEALRVVPGLYVAQMNASNYEISARGFPGLYNNKLLVLIDGRTVYTPTFAGTYWDMQDYVMEDIARIEVR